MNRLESIGLASLCFLIFLPGVMYLFLVVHNTMNRICVGYARRYCGKNNLEIVRVRFQPAFNQSGGKRIKTEFTLVQLDCLDAQKQRKLILLLVWPLGIRKIVSNEKYPDSYDEQWPSIVPPSKIKTLFT